MNLILLDVGGTYIRVAACDGNREEFSFFEIAPSHLRFGKERFLDQVKRIITIGLDRTKWSQGDTALKVSIGLPGHITSDSNVTLPPVFPDLQDVNLISELSDVVSSENVTLENDATARAWGEYVSLISEQPEFEGKTIAVISIGTGLGCGLICDGAPLRGENNLIGELGHMILSSMAQDSSVGVLRVREYCSGSGIPRLAVSLAEEGEPQRLLSIEGSTELTAELLCSKAIEGDPFAARVWDRFMAIFSCLLFNLSCVIDPAAIVVGGGVASSVLFDLNKLEEQTNAHRIGFSKRQKIQIRRSRLGDKGVLYGLRDLHCYPPRRRTLAR